MRELVSIGMAVILIGFILVLIGNITQALSGKSDTKFAVGGIIGFIPLGLGNGKRMAYVVIGLVVFLFVVWLMLGKNLS